MEYSLRRCISNLSLFRILTASVGCNCLHCSDILSTSHRPLERVQMPSLANLDSTWSRCLHVHNLDSGRGDITTQLWWCLQRMHSRSVHILYHHLWQSLVCLQSRLFDWEPLQAECLSGITSAKKRRSQAQDRNSWCKDSHECSDGVSTTAFLYTSSVRADWSNAAFSSPSAWVQQSVGFFGEDSIPKRVQRAQRLRLRLQTQNPGYLWLQPKIKAQLSRARRCSSKASIQLVRVPHNPL